MAPRNKRKKSTPPEIIEVGDGELIADHIEKGRVAVEDRYEYMVEAIVDYFVNKSKEDWFLVKWEGWKSSFNTWQRSEDLENSPDLVAKYFDANPEKKKKRNIVLKYWEQKKEAARRKAEKAESRKKTNGSTRKTKKPLKRMAIKKSAVRAINRPQRQRRRPRHLEVEVENVIPEDVASVVSGNSTEPGSNHLAGFERNNPPVKMNASPINDWLFDGGEDVNLDLVLDINDKENEDPLVPQRAEDINVVHQPAEDRNQVRTPPPGEMAFVHLYERPIPYHISRHIVQGVIVVDLENEEVGPVLGNLPPPPPEYR